MFDEESHYEAKVRTLCNRKDHLPLKLFPMSTFHSFNFSRRMVFESAMSKEYDVVQEFAVSIFTENCDPQSHLLVFTNNGELIDFNSGYEDVDQHVLKIKANDGIHLAWKLFQSMDEMQSFINNHRDIGTGVDKSNSGSTV